MCQRIEHAALNRPLQRPRAVGRIIPLAHELVPGRVGERDVDLALLQPPGQPGDLDIDDLLHVLAPEGVEEDDLVDPVQELRPEVLAKRVHDLPPCAFVHRAALAHRSLDDEGAAEVGGHDHDRVLEIDRSSLAIRQPPIVEELEQYVQHFGVRLLDLVEQHHRVGTTTDGFRELSRFLVPDVSGRRADHAGDRVLLLVLGHVDADHGLIVVEHELGERPGELRLADAGRAKEHEGAERAIGILQAGARAADGIGHRVDRFVLADDAPVQPLFHVNQLLHFAFHHPAHGDVGPLAHDVGDVFLVDFLLEHPVALLDLGQLRFGGADALLELGHAAVLELGRLGVVARALRALDLAAQRFLFLFQRGATAGSDPSPAASDWRAALALP